MSKKYFGINTNENITVKKTAKSFNDADSFDENKRFYVNNAKIGLVKIDGEEHNHLSNVMRFKLNDKVTIICDDDYDYLGKIVEINKKYTLVEINNKVKNLCNPTLNITAYVAVNKREPMSLMIRMLSELGVSNFVPITTKWTQAQDALEKTDRYQKIAEQSAKQCRRSKILKVSSARKLNDVCSEFHKYDAVYFAYEKEERVSLYMKINEQINFAKQKDNFKNVAFIIGPVAGFDTDEAQTIINSGAISVSLGKRILKSDTACILTASIITNSLKV